MAKAIHSDQAPAAVGPYSQAIDTGSFVFCSGQAGLVPETMQLADGGVPGQTKQALENLKAVLEAAGCSVDQIVKTTVFLTDMADFKAMNEVYAEFFGDTRPARSTIAAKQLPVNALVEIEAIALK
jgi:2-iminobutanoate/2-iminopropanoate deaminase